MIIDNLIGGIGILLLLFIAYCAIAIPYYYLKRIFLKTKGIKKSAINLSIKLQKDNTRRTLERLLKAMKKGEENMRNNDGKMLLRDQENVTKIQKQLLLDMIGPAKKLELKNELFDPLIKDKTNSKLIRDGLNHVLKNYKVDD
tara:strand:- start:26 stop:454 length:429 start_codon:yes stop_codon:yes gene_type:complete